MLQTLRNYKFYRNLSKQISTLGGSSEAGGAMKSTTNWRSPNTGATNSSGFTALPGGDRNGSSGAFNNTIGYYGTWWYLEPPYAVVFTLSYNAKNLSTGGIGKTNGFSVRCIKD